MKKNIVLLAIILISIKAIAQEKLNFYLSFDHIALSVKNLDKSAEFYKNTLNLKEITNKTKADGIKWFSLGDGKELHLISTIKGNIKLNKAVHFAVTTSDFDIFIKKLTLMNVNYSSWTDENQKITIRADGVKQVYIQDPNGYWFEVNSVKDKSIN
ncbi:MAG: VOC family protein [Flaviramulus sp.]|nr:VOC family protein [Flaviramulus sp.]